MLNSQLSHINENIKPECSLCTQTNSLNPPSETIRHFILQCNTFSTILNHIYNILSPTSDNKEQIEIFYLGFNTHSRAYNFFGNSITALLWNIIYCYRKSVVLLSRNFLIEQILVQLRRASTASIGFRRTIFQARKFAINDLNNFDND